LAIGSAAKTFMSNARARRATADAAGKAVGKDAAQGKATFVSLLGVERARTQATMLIDQAIAHLQGFGEEADLLRAIARFAIERDR